MTRVPMVPIRSPTWLRTLPGRGGAQLVITRVMGGLVAAGHRVSVSAWGGSKNGASACSADTYAPKVSLRSTPVDLAGSAWT
jgi:hypothetical protein